MLIEIGIAASIGGIVGFGICAVLTAGKVADQCGGECASIREQNDVLHEEVAEWVDHAAFAANEATAAQAAHARCADASATKDRKLSAIRELVGPTEGLRRGRLGQIAAILDGERA